MKKYIFLSILLLYSAIKLTGQEYYYYYKGEKIDLEVNKNYLKIIPVETKEISNLVLRNFNLEQADEKSVVNKESAFNETVKLKFRTEPTKSEYLKIIDSLANNKDIKYIFPYFEKGNTEPISISDIFYVKLKEPNDTILLKKVAIQQSIRIVKQIPFMPDWYMLSLHNSSYSNTVEASNFFYETGSFEDIDPGFMFDFKPTCTNDPLFSQLWGLYNATNPAIDINACEAWNISKGNGVKVAVVDQGIDKQHNDLLANIHSLSFDAQSGTSPSKFNSELSHGTHVAGTVAAIKDNNLQVTGVAPECKLICVSHDLSISPTLSSELANGISWAWQNGADIITNSWGDQGGYFYGQMHSAILENAILNAIALGRSGKGCVVVFAAGNYGHTSPIMDYPANFHADIFTVGSITSSGSRSSSSGYGTKLDVVAPGNNILSTVPNNETGYKSGTSMAAPHVAGIAALILSRNSALTGKNVRDIIESTAQKVGGYSYVSTTGRPNGTWHQQMGYGLVDAYAALTATCALTNLINQTVTTNRTVTGCDIYVKDVSVRSNAKLTLEAQEETKIDGAFEIQNGSMLEIY